jgi:hypothetical protein
VDDEEKKRLSVMQKKEEGLIVYDAVRMGVKCKRFRRIMTDNPKIRQSKYTNPYFVTIIRNLAVGYSEELMDGFLNGFRQFPKAKMKVGKFTVM